MAPFKISIIRTGDQACRIFAETKEKRVDGGERTIPLGHFADAAAPLKAALERGFSTRRVVLDDENNLAAEPLAEANANFERGVAKKIEPLALNPDVKITEEVGSLLFNFLFHGKIEELFRDSMEVARASNEALPIRLSIEHPQLTNIPWEALFDTETRGFISLSRETPFTRAIPGDDLKLSRPKKLPLRILTMVARPSGAGIDEIDADGELIELKRAMKDLEAQAKVEFRWTLSGRQTDLETALIKPDPPEPWNIFHFIGHGGFDPAEGQGYLLIQEDDGSEADLLYAETLRALLLGPNSPQLVVLNSCEGAYSASGDIFSSTAADLVLGGIPAVLAMQFVIRDDMAKIFSRHFYSYLANGISIENALTLTRLKLKKNFSGWIAPVLYLRTSDTFLFT